MIRLDIDAFARIYRYSDLDVLINHQMDGLTWLDSIDHLLEKYEEGSRTQAFSGFEIKEWKMERLLMLASVVCVVASLLIHLELIPANRSSIPFGFLLAVIFWGLSAFSFAKRGPKSDMNFLFHKKQNDEHKK